MGNDLYPEWPQLAVTEGNRLHAVWFTRHRWDLFGSDQGAHYQIWYSTLPLNTPQLVPPPLFTPVPTIAASPTAAPSPTLAPTPLPSAIAAAPMVASDPQWEQRGVVTIAVALLPVGGMLVLLVGVALFLRRR
jgi:hypothetical protein